MFRDRLFEEEMEHLCDLFLSYLTSLLRSKMKSVREKLEKTALLCFLISQSCTALRLEPAAM